MEWMLSIWKYPLHSWTYT